MGYILVNFFRLDNFTRDAMRALRRNSIACYATSLSRTKARKFMRRSKAPPPPSPPRLALIPDAGSATRKKEGKKEKENKKSARKKGSGVSRSADRIRRLIIYPITAREGPPSPLQAAGHYLYISALIESPDIILSSRILPLANLSIGNALAPISCNYRLSRNNATKGILPANFFHRGARGICSKIARILFSLRFILSRARSPLLFPLYIS